MFRLRKAEHDYFSEDYEDEYDYEEEYEESLFSCGLSRSRRLLVLHSDGTGRYSQGVNRSEKMQRRTENYESANRRARSKSSNSRISLVARTNSDSIGNGDKFQRRRTFGLCYDKVIYEGKKKANS